MPLAKVGLAITAAAALGMTVPVRASDLSVIVDACWEYRGFKTNDRKEPPRSTLNHIHQICFRRDGSADGFTYHDRDAWDWSVDYELMEEKIIINGLTWTVISVDQRQFTVEDGGEPRTYRYVCRTTDETSACGLL
ncbi:hypothetical protein SSBR45G_72820 [Bradyrhizobium sp. SSBR45G]|uniref:hypothetical protein n=1 Tax=unclassified Bradyrhizobium TaxID=2631580 RepID=UPI002342B4B0|nr:MULTISPECIES: hypothetical protein [unclassified Bradyrhizobium]GLH82373.1 hypothetical protein SSBR45G_72820 [Bradyrhizobium sp. SSBR45G]GLH89806.1 hypothetical protein SSBR45R_72670 [Bradyrhizobium sp. SSBR45R]